MAAKSDEKWKLNIWVDHYTIKLPSIIKLKKAGFNIINIDKNLFKLNDLDSYEYYNIKYQRTLFEMSINVAIKVDILKYQILKYMAVSLMILILYTKDCLLAKN